MEAQEIFDRVARHLRDQGAKSQHTDERCAYRGENGLKCAVGCLIEDDDLARQMDGLYNADVYDVYHAGLLPEVLYPHIALLRALQDVHDTCGVREWAAVLAGVASDFSLRSDHLIRDGQWIEGKP